MSNLRIPKSRKFRVGGFATAVTVGFIVLILIVNVIATVLLERYPLSVDLTESGVYGFSQETMDILEEVEEPIQIYMLENEATFADPLGDTYQMSEILKKYTQYNTNVTLEYIDLNANPTWQQRFNTEYPSETLARYDLIVQSDKRMQHFTINDYVNGSTMEDFSSSMEQCVSGALLYVTDLNPMVATIVSGHGEEDSSGLENLLTKNGYVVKTIDTYLDEFDEDTQLVIVASPTVDFTEREIDKLDAFLANGGDYEKQMIYIASATQPELPRLEGFLEEWGIGFDAGVLVETDANMTYQSTSGYLTLQQLTDSTKVYAENATKPSNYIVMMNARPLKALYEEDGRRSTSTVLTTLDTGALRPADATDSWEPSVSDVHAYDTVIIGEHSSDDVYGEESVSSVAVFASVEMVDTTFLAQSSMGNATFVIDTVNALTGKEASVLITPTDLSTELLSISEAQAVTVGIIFIAVIPLAVAACGIVVYLRRRHK